MKGWNEKIYSSPYGNPSMNSPGLLYSHLLTDQQNRFLLTKIYWIWRFHPLYWFGQSVRVHVYIAVVAEKHRNAHGLLQIAVILAAGETPSHSRVRAAFFWVVHCRHVYGLPNYIDIWSECVVVVSHKTQPLGSAYLLPFWPLLALLY